ncbi:hypothetical protein LCGC14_0748300 [marine sediment metagenome]|uniref:Uncharacterized protein n=1 Tax=marine sediment metagenome TaxID=412755 RepID=A0A0F9SPQ5_9ZZZZ|nr:MAG: small GTP-binding domain protein [Candidatus Lokiarchaeum sp. GC14_75]
MNYYSADFYGAELIIFVYNITDFTSINVLPKWWDAIKRAFKDKPKKFPSLILVGNIYSEFAKPDYIDTYLDDYTEIFNVINVFKCSLKDTHYVGKIFSAALHEIIQRNMPKSNEFIGLVGDLDKFGPIFNKILCPNCKHLTSSGNPFCHFCNFRTDHEKNI